MGFARFVRKPICDAGSVALGGRSRACRYGGKHTLRVPPFLCLLVGLLLVSLPMRSGEMDLDHPKDSAVDFLMLPAGDRVKELKRLTRSGDPRAADLIAEVLSSEDAEVAADERLMEEYVLPYFSVFATPKHYEQASRAAKSDNAKLRRWAAAWLGYTGAPEAVKDLESLLDSDDGFVRRAAIAGLRSLCTAEAARVLGALEKRTKDAEDKDLAAKARARVEANLARGKNLPNPYPPDFSTVTPHVPWAKPLARRLRVLLLSERATLRDVVEIAQRMDIDPEYIEIPCVVGKGVGDIQKFEIRDDTRAVVLDRLDRDWDTILVASMTTSARLPGGSAVGNSHGVTGWPSFPEEVQRAILKKTGGGTGLVLMDAGPTTVAGAPVEPPKAGGLWAWPDGLELQRFGKGRIARFSRGTAGLSWGSILHDLGARIPLGKGFQVPGLPGRTRQVYPAEDFFYSALCRVLLWSAGRSPMASITEATLDAPAGAAGKTVLSLDGDIPNGAIVSLEIADAYNRVIATGKAPAAAKCEITLPPLPAGAVVIRAKLLDEKGNVFNWSGFLAEIKGTARIAEVVLPPLPISPTQPLWAEVKLSGDVPAGSKLRAEAADPWGRLVGRAEAVPKDSKAMLAFDSGRLLSRVVTLKIVLETPDAKPLAYVQQPVVVANTDDYKDVPWVNAGGDSYLELWSKIRPDYLQEMSLETLECGLDIMAPGFGGGAVPSHDPGPYSADGIRVPCLTSAKWDRQLEQAANSAGAANAPLDCRLYILSDETDLGGEYCWSPTCLDQFREYLQQEYGSLGALNASWNTKYAKWEDVRPLRAAELEDGDHPGPWLDHVIFQDQVYTGMYDRVQTILRSHIPGAKAGSSTTGTVDQWLFARRQGMAALFVSIRYRYEEMSFRPADQLLGGWFEPGYSYAYLNNEAGTWYWGWDQILHGATMIITWIGAYGFAYPMVRADLAPDAILLHTRDMVEDMRSGYGRLLLGAERRAGDWAMYYSPRSNLIDTAILKTDRPWEVKAVRRVAPAYDAEMIFRFPRILAYAEVEMGYLRKRPPKVLYLPLIRCMSRTEVEEIANYVREGGVLLASADPGVRDTHGVPREKWPFEDVFGLRRKPGRLDASQKWEPLPVEVLGVVEKIDLTDLDLVLAPGPKPPQNPPVIVGEDVEATEAKPLFRIGGKPCGFVHPYGKGLAIYFNFEPCSLTLAPGNADAPNAHQVLLDRIFRARGIRRGYEIDWAVGRPTVAGRPAFALAEFDDGTGRYLAFLRSGEGALEDQPKEKLKLTLDAAARVYDSRNAKLLGEGKEFQIEFPRGLPCILALMPYAVKAVEVSCEGAAPGKTATIRTRVVADGGRVGRHVLALRVYRPDGTEARWFRKNIDTPDGTFEHTLPLAWNEPAGSYRVRVRDVATGTMGETTLTVR